MDFLAPGTLVSASREAKLSCSSTRMTFGPRCYRGTVFRVPRGELRFRYSLIQHDESGRNQSASHSRQENARRPWSRLYSKRVWRNLRFPEDYWFEDTVQMFCIDTQYTERYIDKHLYRYCVNHGGITANASSSKKGLDSYWICEEMLDWCRKLGVPFDRKLYKSTIEQLGPLTWKRCMALTRDEHCVLSNFCGPFRRFF